ncbi:MAG: D-2-hydroxyacid dehydrogenase, partial [Colwellia sp.]
MKAVFLDRETFNNNIDLSAISEHVDELTCYDMTRADDIVHRCKDATVVIVNKVLLNKEILESLPKLKYIGITATGYNNVDIKSASRLGITVTNVSGYAGASVSQYVFSQILAYYQQITHHNENTQKGLWQQSRTFCYHGNAISELAGKTIAIIGYGNLGKSVELIARAFDMKVLISERVGKTVIREGRVALNEALAQADIITLHCPQTPDTENLINAHRLKMMKPSAMLINTARGPLIDETALLYALKANEIAYAALDVLSVEPPPKDHPLLSANLNNLKITAHIAWASSEAQQRLITLVGRNIEAYKQGEKLNQLN